MHIGSLSSACEAMERALSEFQHVSAPAVQSLSHFTEKSALVEGKCPGICENNGDAPTLWNSHDRGLKMKSSSTTALVRNPFPQGACSAKNTFAPGIANEKMHFASPWVGRASPQVRETHLPHSLLSHQR